MPRYIDADALNAYIESAECNSVGKALQAIDNAPTVSPDEVRGVGKWTNRRTIEHDGEYWCTACGKEITIYMGVDRKDRYNYCPNCGAKMEVSEDG